MYEEVEQLNRGPLPNRHPFPLYFKNGYRLVVCNSVSMCVLNNARITMCVIVIDFRR